MTFRLRTKTLALEVIKFVEHMPHAAAADVLRRQVIKSATSSGANYRAACRSQLRAAFVAKISVVIEERDETMYWLELMRH
jgi:four helix bundle protein